MSEPTDDNPWILLGELISARKVPVSKLAHAIKEEGIQTYNQHGIRIYATEGSKEDKTSKAYVLELLADYFKISDDPQPTYEQLTDLYWSTEWDRPLSKFGWPADELPNFDKINPDYVTSKKIKPELESNFPNNLKDVSEDSIEFAQSEMAKANKTTLVKNKLHRNSLDPAIDEAIKLAGNLNCADVYLQLKELALNGTPPFNGVIEGDALCYTADNDLLKKIKKDALCKRLKRRT